MSLGSTNAARAHNRDKPSPISTLETVKMSTLPELITHRTTAGARYVAALTELRAAFGDLSAIDRLLALKTPFEPVVSFGGPQPDVIPLRHPTFCPGSPNPLNASLVGRPFEDDCRAAFATRLAAFGTPDTP
jgi:hypothetical protein